MADPNWKVGIGAAAGVWEANAAAVVVAGRPPLPLGPGDTEQDIA